jgi:EmrB/QacA subfamily drug resistance transporter
MIVLDISILNVALPSIEREFNLGVKDLQWIVVAYTLCFGGFLLLGGRAADLYGRRRVFLSGVVCFTLVSLLIGIVDNPSYMIPLRGLQGLAAAFMSPSALSLVLALFTERNVRARALSIWGAVSAGGATAGLLLGGLLTEYLNWRWNFFVNVPIGVIVIIAALRLLPAHAAEERTKSLDLPGAVLVTSGLMLLVYALSQASSWGWMSASTLGLIALGVALIVAFIFNESRATHPLMPLSIFRIGNVAAADLVQLPITASLFSMFFFLSLYVQNILHYTPLEAGFAFLPTTLTVGMSAILAPRLIQRIGYKTILITAPLLLAGGLYTFGHVELGGTYLDFLPGLLIMAAGLGFSFVSVTIAATTGVPPAESGLASGLLTTAQQIGGSLGLAILTSIAATTTANVMSTSAEVPAQALLSGFHAAFYTGMWFAVGASVVALLFIRSMPQQHH